MKKKEKKIRIYTSTTGDGRTWKLESCSFSRGPVRVEIRTELLSSCSFCTQARARFLPTSLSKKKKLLERSHNSILSSSWSVTDLTPARTRFFAVKGGQKRYLAKLVVKDK
jgi:hypothetical protein